MGKFKDLTGQIFGKWVVIDIDDSKPRLHWWCECECGAEKSIRASSLTSGNSKGCRECTKQNLIGKTFTRLTVVKDSRQRSSNGNILWECNCSCGKEGQLVRGSDLINGQIKSCGCYSTEKLKQVATTHGLSKVNGKKTKLFMAWDAMKQRCNNVNHASYKDYGGRGITVCEEWMTSFKAFHDWSRANGFADDLSIDRIDNDKGYSPDNCRWADAKTQIRNRRNTVTYEWKGQQYTVGELGELSGVNKKTIKSRLNRGCSVAEAIDADVGNSELTLTYKGETKPIKQWCKELDLHYPTVRTRHYRGWSDEGALTGIRNK